MLLRQVFRHLPQPLCALPVQSDRRKNCLDLLRGGSDDTLKVREAGDEVCIRPGRGPGGSPFQQDFCDDHLIERRVTPPRELT